jgi:hypothetical protein
MASVVPISARSRLDMCVRQGRGSVSETGRTYVVDTIAQTKTTVTTRGPDSVEPRLEVHYLTNDAVEIEVLTVPNARIRAWLMNLCQSGVRVWLKGSIEINTVVKIRLRSDAAILGKVRYCRPRGGGFDAVILIQEVTRSRLARNQHVSDDELSLYLVGKKLTVTETIRLKDHLGGCESCRIRLAETNAILFAVPKRGGL